MFPETGSPGGHTTPGRRMTEDTTPSLSDGPWPSRGRRRVDVAVTRLNTRAGHGSHDTRQSHESCGWTETLGRVRVRSAVAIPDRVHPSTHAHSTVNVQEARTRCIYCCYMCVHEHAPVCTLGEMGPGRGPKPGLRCWAGLANTPEALADHSDAPPAPPVSRPSTSVVDIYWSTLLTVIKL